jgi:hypothetical protein
MLSLKTTHQLLIREYERENQRGGRRGEGEEEREKRRGRRGEGEEEREIATMGLIP